MKIVVRLDGTVERNGVVLHGVRIHKIGAIHRGEPVRVELEDPDGYRTETMCDLLIVCHSREHDLALQAFMETDPGEAW